MGKDAILAESVQPDSQQNISHSPQEYWKDFCDNFIGFNRKFLLIDCSSIFGMNESSEGKVIHYRYHFWSKPIDETFVLLGTASFFFFFVLGQWLFGDYRL